MCVYVMFHDCVIFNGSFKMQPRTFFRVRFVLCYRRYCKFNERNCLLCDKIVNFIVSGHKFFFFVFLAAAVVVIVCFILFFLILLKRNYFWIKSWIKDVDTENNNPPTYNYLGAIFILMRMVYRKSSKKNSC